MKGYIWLFYLIALINFNFAFLSANDRKIGLFFKLSIARAILKDSDIIIFDEATSELDSESEGRIENLIKERFKEKTCIIISHKPFTNNFLKELSS